MSQSRSDPGQSMEEILASIRRIISEGEREAALDAGGPSELVQSRPPSPPEPADRTTAAMSQTEVLVLTEMVQDDGSVISLQSAAAVTEVEPEDIGAVSPTISASEAEPPVPTAAAIAASLEAVRAAIETAAPPDPAVRPDPIKTSSASIASIADTAVPPEQAAVSPTPSPLPTPPLPSSTAQERIPVSSEGLKKPELVSEEALAASTAALAQLAQSVTRTREPAPGQARTVDDLVREAVEPLLKQWLDQNLPRIVERMVREAIDRVVRRVE